MQVGDEVRLPGLAAVARKRLLDAMRIRFDVEPYEPREDRAAADVLLIVELAATVLELAEHRRAHHAVVAGREELAPLVRAGVVEEEAEILEMAVGPVGFDFFEQRFSAPDLVCRHGAVELDPFLRSAERMAKAPDVRGPGAV